MTTLTHLDLFSGIGGFTIAAQRAGFTTIGFSEIEPYACKILAQNFGAFMANPDGTRKSQPLGSVKELREWVVNGGESGTVPNYGDIRTMRGVPCDLITGGFPCQPFSLAGKRGGAGDDRALWPSMLRVIGESQPRWVLGENVPGIINMELDNLLSDLEGIGYSAWPIVIPACAVDARHRRDRVWIVANRTNERVGWREQLAKSGKGSRDVAHAAEGRLRRGRASRDAGQPARSGEAVADTEGAISKWSERHGNARGRNGLTEPSRWPTESGIRRVAHGIPNRAHRLKGLGNAIVPQVAGMILREMAKDLVTV